jgi:glycosyltransferase involved in cell wall biosynthesis
LASLKIIYYSPHPTHDIVSEVGYSTHQRETIHAFRQLGHEVVCVVLGGTEKESVNTFHRQIDNKSSRSLGLKKWIPLFLWNALKDIRLLQHDKKAGRQLEQAILKFQPDLIYERGEYLQDSGVLMAEKYGIRHYLEVNSPVVEEMSVFEGSDILRFLGHQKEKIKLRKTHKVFAVSSAIKEYLIQRYQCKKAIEVIPNCINPEALTEIDKDANPIYKKGDNEFTIGFVGSLFPYHGVDLLIDSFSEFVKINTDAKLVIVGDGAVKSALMQQASTLLPPDSYFFTGKVPHKQALKYIQSFDVAVMAASNWYGSPVKIFEYGLMGKPIIAPDNGPVRDVMDPELDGFLVKALRTDLVAILNFINNQPEEAHKRAQHFRQKILDTYTWKNQASFILNDFN